MEAVTLNAFAHGQQECISIFFLQSNSLNSAEKKIAGIKWSQTSRCWYLGLSKDSVTAVIKALGKIAAIETKILKLYLQK